MITLINNMKILSKTTTQMQKILNQVQTKWVRTFYILKIIVIICQRIFTLVCLTNQPKQIEQTQLKNSQILTNPNQIQFQLRQKLIQLQEKTRKNQQNKIKTNFLQIPSCVNFSIILEIMKSEQPRQSTQFTRFNQQSLRKNQRKNISIDSTYQNQFIQINSTSTKNRGPRIIENQITNLSNHHNIARRRIVSEQRTRNKFQNKSIDRMKETNFDNFKKCFYKDHQNNDHKDHQNIDNLPKDNFQNLQIITFYNKFPNLKRVQPQDKQFLFQKKKDFYDDKNQFIISKK